jgi:type III secretion system YscQ/HrcQ family protein
MTSRFQLLSAAGSRAAPYQFQDLPAVSGAGAGSIRQVVGLWWPLLSGQRVEQTVVELFRRYCKVKEAQPPLLVVKKGGPGVKEISVDASVFTIGRKKGNHLVLTEAGVSGVHAQILRRGDRWEIADPGSVNGTVVNTQRLAKDAPCALKSGDVIAIMGTEMVFKLHDPELRPPQVVFAFRGFERTVNLPPETNTVTNARIGLHGCAQLVDLLLPTRQVRSWLESLVGLRYTEESVVSPLSDVEKGLAEFLLLKMLQLVHRHAMAGGQELFYLAALDSPLQTLTPSAEAVVAHFAIRFEDSEGDVWLRIPEGVIRFWLDRGGESALRLAEPDTAYWLARLDGWDWLSVPLAVVAGGVRLSLAEMLSLEPGDIILMPEGAPAGDPDTGLAGPVRLKPRGGSVLSGSAALKFADGRYTVTFDKFCREQSEAAMPEKTPETPPANPAETPGELMSDLALTLEVELDRVALKLSELVQLVPGQIIQLQRSPSDPVDLSVNGQVVGRGQLVKINDALGVKILSMKK